MADNNPPPPPPPDYMAAMMQQFKLNRQFMTGIMQQFPRPDANQQAVPSPARPRVRERAAEASPPERER
jgi:hypothetical protein